MIFTHHIAIPAILVPDILQLIAICHRCVDCLLDSASKLFTDFTNATVGLGKVDELESEADNLEFKLYEQIFSGDFEGMDKILLRDLIKNITSVSDRAENAGDRIRIIVAKRGT